MPEVIQGARHSPLTAEQLEVFKDQIRETRTFLRNKFDMNELQQASFLVNMIAVSVIDLYSEVGDPNVYLKARMQNINDCIEKNFKLFYNLED